MKSIKKINGKIVICALTAVLAVGTVAAVSTIDRTTSNTNVSLAVTDYESKYEIDSSKLGTGTTYYVSPDTMDAKDATYTKEDRGSLSQLLLNDKLQPGDTIVVAPGTYKFSVRMRVASSGSPSGYIQVINETVKDGDTQKKAVLDFSALKFDGNNRGVQIDGDYWYWNAVDICGAGDNGMYIGGSYNVIENSEFYNNRDTGLQLGRSDSNYSNIVDWPSYNLIKNCTSYNNYDNETYGENADGFAAKLTVGYGNIFDGCIAYRNSDDGWDLYAKADSGNIGAVILYNCVAFENGYLGETQASFNAKCGFYDSDGNWKSSYNSNFDEAVTNSYTTRDGDGNGFKLGGSVMEGDVYLYNCMAFNNRMHGVTDNSNPGVLTIENVTSYNNAAAVNNDPTSENFGQIDYSLSTESCNNIDLSRQTYSYNIMGGILSVYDGNNNLGGDLYRGSSYNSVYLTSTYGSMTVKDVADVSSTTEAYAVKGTEGSGISTSVFASVPTKDVLSGINSTSVNDSIHTTYRNADGSINMKDILRITNYESILSGSSAGVIGAYLCGTSWSSYTHYAYVNASYASDESNAAVQAAHATVNLNTNMAATYQDFDLNTVMEGVTISWASSDTSIIAIEEGTASVSGTKDSRAIVYRGSEKKEVTLTATITSDDKKASATRDFKVTVMPDQPTIGEAVLTGVEDDVVIYDRFDSMPEPEFSITNAADYNGKLLDPSTYTVTTEYLYATNSNGYYVEIQNFTTSVPGVYKINKSVTLKSDGSHRNYSYTIYVAGRSADVGFTESDGASSEIVNVNRYGYTISGGVTSAVGKIYSLASATPIENITTEQVMTDGTSYEFRANSISYQFEGNNTGNYYIYYVLGNLLGEATTEVKTVEVTTQEISTAEQFKNMLINNNSSTIYILTSDIDLSGENNWVNDVTGKKVNFTGLLNGMGHTVKGLNVTSTDNEYASMFYRLEGGTIENIKFENITISGAQKVGLIATSYGGYLYNIAINEITVTGDQRLGGLLGQAIAGTTEIEQVSVINKRTYSVASDITANSFADNTYYVKEGESYVKASASDYSESNTYYTLDADFSGDRMAAIVGFIQASSANDYTEVYINECYVDSVFGTGNEQYCGSVVGRYDDRNAKDYLQINNCYSSSIMRANKYQGGIIGGQSGAGKLRMSGDVFTGELYYASDLANKLTSSLKNCSGIMGYYASNADAEISNCYAGLQEYNTNYDVGFAEVIIPSTGIANESFWTTTLEYNTESKWTLVKDGNGNLTTPYVQLNFLAVS